MIHWELISLFHCVKSRDIQLHQKRYRDKVISFHTIHILPVEFASATCDGAQGS